MAKHRPMSEVPAVAARQAGAFTRAQAVDAGWSKHQVSRRVLAGRWEVLLGRALVAAGAPVDERTLAWATHLSVPRGVVSHLTAGRLHGFPIGRVARVGHVITRRTVVPSGVHAHRVPLGRREMIVMHGLPVTDRARTALDCLTLLDLDDARHLWAWLVTRKVLTTADLAAAVRRRLSRPGTPVLLGVLRMALTGAGSVAELRLHRLLRRAGITGWKAGVTVRDRGGRTIGVVDILFEEERVVIEVEGYVAHSSRRVFTPDRRRRRAITVAGYTVVPVTWDDLCEQPLQVVAQIKEILRQRHRKIRRRREISRQAGTSR